MVLSDDENKIINSIKEKIPNTDNPNGEISINKDEINKLIGIYDKLNNEVTQLEKQKLEQTNRTETDITSTTDKDDLTLQVTILTRDKTNLQQQVTTLTNDNAEIQKQVSTLTDDKAEIQKQVTTLTDDKTNLQQQVTTLTNDKTLIQQQVTSLTSDKTNLQQQVTSLTNENNNLQQQQLSNENDPEEIVNLKNNINSISKEMTSIMEKITNDNKQNFLQTYFESNKRDDANNPIITPKITNIDIGNNKTAKISDLIFANQGQLLPSNVEVNINTQDENNINNSVSAKITFTKQNIAYVENLTTSVTNTLETTKANDHIV